MKKNLAGLYCRLSSEDIDKINKGDESESIQNQKVLLIDYANKNDWEIYKIYCDDDYSGLDRNRPAYNQMISDAKAGKIQIILCKHQSRFTRDLEVVEKYIHGLFPLLGVRFVSIIDHVDTDIKGNKKARQINALMNEWYVEDLSENIRTVFRKKMESGQFIGSFAPYGYRKDPENRYRLIVDPIAAEVVKNIFELYLDGKGYKMISEELTSRGIMTPIKYMKSIGLKITISNKKYSEALGIWSVNTVRRILTNKIYIGWLIQGKETRVSYKNQKRIYLPEKDWIVIKKNHKEIVSEQVFFEVQNLIENKRRIRKPKIDNCNKYLSNKTNHVLGGKIRCLYCGENMHMGAKTRDGLSNYVRCGLYVKTKKHQCRPNYIRMDQIEGEIEKRIRMMIRNSMGNQNVFINVRESLFNMILSDSEISRKKKELENIELQINEIKNMIGISYMDKIKGILSDQDFIHLKNQWGIQRQRLERDQHSLYLEIDQMGKKINTLEAIEELIVQYMDFKVLTREAVHYFVDWVEVGKGEMIINWKI